MRFHAFGFILIAVQVASAYFIGSGIADITGPCTEINFMGYALPNQRGDLIFKYQIMELILNRLGLLQSCCFID